MGAGVHDFGLVPAVLESSRHFSDFFMLKREQILNYFHLTLLRL